MGPETASVSQSSIDISSRYFLTLLRYSSISGRASTSISSLPHRPTNRYHGHRFLRHNDASFLSDMANYKRINILLFTTYFKDTSDAIKKSGH